MIPPEIKKLYPFRSEYFSVMHQSRSLKLHYIDENKEADSFTPLLCLHGNPTWSFYFRNIISHFSKTRRVMALDHMGCGGSDTPQDYSYQLEQHCENLTAFLEKQNLQKVDLLVHDWGGAIGMGWATKNPEKVGNIILTNTAAFSLPHIPHRIALCKIPWAGEFMVRRFNAFAKAALYMAPNKPLAAEVRNGMIWPYRSYERRIAVARFVQDIPLNRAHRSWEYLEDINQGLQNIEGRKLILWGKQDFCFNEKFLTKWREVWPGAEVKVFPEGGHYLLEDEAQGCIEAMEDFLDHHEYC